MLRQKKKNYLCVSICVLVIFYFLIFILEKACLVFFFFSSCLSPPLYLMSNYGLGNNLLRLFRGRSIENLKCQVRYHIVFQLRSF